MCVAKEAVEPFVLVAIVAVIEACALGVDARQQPACLPIHLRFVNSRRIFHKRTGEITQHHNGQIAISGDEALRVSRCGQGRNHLFVRVNFTRDMMAHFSAGDFDNQRGPRPITDMPYR